MILYFDTSALVKLFSIERGSELVKQLVTEPENEVFVLELALIELTCAVYRKYRNKEISEEKLEPIQAAIEQQFLYFKTIPLASDIVEESRTMMKKFGKEYGLRTLDAFHIAGWSLFAEQNWIFVSSDKNQLNVVEEMNCHIIAV